MKDDTIRQSKHTHIEAVQGKPTGEQGQEKVKDAPTPTVSGLQKHQADSHNVYTEALMQILTGSVFVLQSL